MARYLFHSNKEGSAPRSHVSFLPFLANLTSSLFVAGTMASDDESDRTGRDRAPISEGSETIAEQPSPRPTLTSSRNSSSSRGRRRRKGKTRIPLSLVSIRVLQDLGYPYEVKGDVVIVHQALGQEDIDEIVKLSSEENEGPEDTASQSTRNDYPRQGKTRIPLNLASISVIKYLGYPFVIEGDTIVILQALGQDHINEILQLSHDDFQEINKSDQGTEVTSTDALVSGTLDLRDPPKTSKVCEPDLKSPEFKGAWKSPKSNLANNTIISYLYTIQAAECYMDESGLHKVTLSCLDGPPADGGEENLVKMRWL